MNLLTEQNHKMKIGIYYTEKQKLQLKKVIFFFTAVLVVTDPVIETQS